MKKALRLFVAAITVIVLSLSLFACKPQEKEPPKNQTELVGEVAAFSIQIFNGADTYTFDNTMTKDMPVTAVDIQVTKGEITETKSFKGVKLSEVYAKTGVTAGTVNTIEFFSADGYHKGFSGEAITNNDFYVVFFEKTGAEYLPLEKGPARIVNCLSADKTTNSTKAWVSGLQKIVINYDSTVTIKNGSNTAEFNIHTTKLIAEEITIITTKNDVQTTNVFKAVKLSDVITETGLTLAAFNNIYLSDRSGSFTKDVALSSLDNLYIAIAVKDGENFVCYDEFGQPFIRFVNSSENKAGNWVRELNLVEFNNK